MRETGTLRFEIHLHPSYKLSQSYVFGYGNLILFCANAFNMHLIHIFFKSFSIKKKLLFTKCGILLFTQCGVLIV